MTVAFEELILGTSSMRVGRGIAGGAGAAEDDPVVPPAPADPPQPATTTPSRERLVIAAAPTSFGTPELSHLRTQIRALSPRPSVPECHLRAGEL